MSVYLIYFEKKQHPINNDFSGFKNVNNYTLPEVLHGEEIIVDYLGNKIKANIIYDGISSGEFYHFGEGDTRNNIVINVELMLPDYNNTLRAMRLNPSEALSDWLSEAAEPILTVKDDISENTK